MNNRIGQDGIIDIDKLKKSIGFPSEERLAKGPVAIIECPEEIPCNPCESICPQAAIKVGKSLTNLPVFREEKCNGCTLCIPRCPGMAIFVVDLTYSKNEAIIQFPYEFHPLPAVQDERKENKQFPHYCSPNNRMFWRYKTAKTNNLLLQL